MSDEISVRRAGVDDARALAVLRYEFRLEVAEPVEERAAFLRRCEEWMARELAGEHWRCWVAVADGKTVGGVWIYRLEKLPNPGGNPEAHAYLSNFFILPAFRGRGAGGAMLDAALAWCEQARIDSVFLWPTQRSKPLYMRHGFRVAVGLLDRPVSGHFDPLATT